MSDDALLTLVIIFLVCGIGLFIENRKEKAKKRREDAIVSATIDALYRTGEWSHDESLRPEDMVSLWTYEPDFFRVRLYERLGQSEDCTSLMVSDFVRFLLYASVRIKLVSMDMWHEPAVDRRLRRWALELPAHLVKRRGNETSFRKAMHDIGAEVVADLERRGITGGPLHEKWAWCSQAPDVTSAGSDQEFTSLMIATFVMNHWFEPPGKNNSHASS